MTALPIRGRANVPRPPAPPPGQRPPAQNRGTGTIHPQTTGRPRRAARLLPVAAAVLGPVALTAVLLPVPEAERREYAYLYLAAIAGVGLVGGWLTALLSAVLCVVAVDLFLLPPYLTLAIASPADVVDLVVFLAVAVGVGGLGSRWRRAQIGAREMAARLQAANLEMERSQRERAEAAAVAVRLARAEQQVRLLEASDRVRTDLLANVSHELRTPLTSLLTGASDLLTRPELPAAARSEVAALAGQARRLERLVADLLDMARIEGHALTLNPVEVDLGDAIGVAAARLRRGSPGRPVDVVTPAGGLEVLADWDRLGQILDNLLQNADHHAPPGTPITVSAAPGKRSMVVIRVIDRGPGVAAEDRERIFERFVRGGDGERHGAAGEARAAGTGLGLAIVRGLVEAHAGRVWMEEPEEGEGGRFAFTLPAA